MWNRLTGDPILYGPILASCHQPFPLAMKRYRGDIRDVALKSAYRTSCGLGGGTISRGKTYVLWCGKWFLMRRYGCGISAFCSPSST
jgi:hypothetical protein